MRSETLHRIEMGERGWSAIAVLATRPPSCQPRRRARKSRAWPPQRRRYGLPTDDPIQTITKSEKEPKLFDNQQVHAVFWHE